MGGGRLAAPAAPVRPRGASLEGAPRVPHQTPAPPSLVHVHAPPLRRREPGAPRPLPPRAQQPQRRREWDHEVGVLGRQGPHAPRPAPPEDVADRDRRARVVLGVLGPRAAAREDGITEEEVDVGPYVARRPSGAAGARAVAAAARGPLVGSPQVRVVEGGEVGLNPRGPSGPTGGTSRRGRGPRPCTKTQDPGRRNGETTSSRRLPSGIFGPDHPEWAE